MGTDERKFIHDLATPLSAASLTLEAVIEELKSPECKNLELVQYLSDALKSIEKIKTLLEERRTFLIKNG